MSLNDMDSPESDNGKFAFPNMGDDPKVISQVSLDSFAETADPIDDGAALTVNASKKRHLLWLWIALAVMLLLGAVAGGGYWFFQSHALPGVMLWGKSMTGQSRDHIIQEISDTAESLTVPVSYEGTSKKVTLKDLGVAIDAESIAENVMNAKRDDSFFQKYAFWSREDVDVESFDDSQASAQTVGDMLGVQSVSATNPSLQLNADGTAFDVTPGQQGTGIDVTDIVKEAKHVLESFGKQTAQMVTLKNKVTDPVITDDQAKEAKASADAWIAKPVAIKIGDHKVAEFGAQAMASAITLGPDSEKLGDNQIRNGSLIIDGDKLQQYYNDSIKSNFHADRVDGDVIVNSVGDVLQTNIDGHDGITVSDGGDTNVGRDAAEAFSKGSDSVSIQGTCDAQNEKKTTRTVVVSLSSHTVTAIENGQTVRVMHMSAGQGNDYQTGQCQPSGDLCTPTYCDPNSYDNCTPDGDFKVWLKYQSQDMSGTLTLSDGNTEKWDVKDVGFVNYFSKTGCAIHRIATQSAFNDSSIQAMGKNTSHGCVGVGWDQAEWFYNWCLMGTTVHVQA